MTNKTKADQLYKIVMKLYPWVSEAEARKIANEAETKRNDHMFDAANRLKPKSAALQRS